MIAISSLQINYNYQISSTMKFITISIDDFTHDRRLGRLEFTEMILSNVVPIQYRMRKLIEGLRVQRTIESFGLSVCFFN